MEISDLLAIFEKLSALRFLCLLIMIVGELFFFKICRFRRDFSVGIDMWGGEGIRRNHPKKSLESIILDGVKDS
jgi:hypothetical protein